MLKGNMEYPKNRKEGKWEAFQIRKMCKKEWIRLINTTMKRE